MKSPTKKELAHAICQVAEAGGMPDGFWQSDSRIALARAILGDEEVEKYYAYVVCDCDYHGDHGGCWSRCTCKGGDG
jgi:hypothetical protein